MKPLNQKERNNLFFQFLLFYVISLVVVLFAAFGNVQMTSKQSEDLAKRNNLMQAKVSSLTDFTRGMTKIEAIFSQLNALPDLTTREQDFIDQKEKLQEAMRSLPKSDSTLTSSMKSIITGYNTRWSEKEAALKSKDCLNSLNQAQSDLAQRKKDYNKLVQLYNQLSPSTPAQLIPE